MDEERISELQKLVYKKCLIILPALKARREILEEEFLVLFEYLDELKGLMKGDVVAIYSENFNLP